MNTPESKDTSLSSEIDKMSLEEITRLCFGKMKFTTVDPESEHPVNASRQLQIDWASQREHPAGFGAREFFIVRNYAMAMKHGEEFEVVPGTEYFEYRYKYLVSNPTDDYRLPPYYEESKRLTLPAIKEKGTKTSEALTEDEALRLVKEYLWPAYRESPLIN